MEFQFSILTNAGLTFLFDKNQ